MGPKVDFNDVPIRWPNMTCSQNIFCTWGCVWEESKRNFLLHIQVQISLRSSLTRKQVSHVVTYIVIGLPLFLSSPEHILEAAFTLRSTVDKHSYYDHSYIQWTQSIQMISFMPWLSLMTPDVMTELAILCFFKADMLTVPMMYSSCVSVSFRLFRSDAGTWSRWYMDMYMWILALLFLD